MEVLAQIGRLFLVVTSTRDGIAQGRIVDIEDGTAHAEAPLDALSRKAWRAVTDKAGAAVALRLASAQ